jgi:hypothetical protein
MFWKIWLIGAIVIVLGWVAYGVWRVIDSYREKKRPTPRSKRLQEVRKSFEEYAKKMKQFEKPTYKREQDKSQGTERKS